MGKKILITLAVLISLIGVVFSLPETNADSAAENSPSYGQVIKAQSNREFYTMVGELAKVGAEKSSARIIVKADPSYVLPKLTGMDSAICDDEGMYVIQFETKKQAEAAETILAQDEKVEYAELDKLMKICEEENLSETAMATAAWSGSHYSWGCEPLKVDAYGKYAGYKSDKELIVAVIDSGICYEHPFFRGRLVAGNDFINYDPNCEDDNGHGTHVSGIIVDCTRELDNIKIMPVKVLDSEGEGFLSVIASGIRYAADSGAKVLNISLGGSHSRTVDRAIMYAIENGCTPVVAAGNENEKIDSWYDCPAHISEAITVASVNSEMRKSVFSNYGSEVDFAAPGTRIKSAFLGNTYATFSGTSMATPHITACAAMVKLVNPKFSAAQIEAELAECSKDLGVSGKDKYYGYGIPQLSRLVKPIPITITFNDNGGSGGPEFQKTAAGKSVTLSGMKPERHYTVKLNAMGGSLSSNAAYISVPFEGWNSASDGTGKNYMGGKPYVFEKSVDLFARWGTVNLGELPVPVRDGYEFAGWYADEEYSTALDPDMIISGNIKAYGKWKKALVVTSDWKQLESDHEYNNDDEAEWLYTAPADIVGTMELTFDERTFTEEDRDYIEITDEKGNTAGRYTGGQLAGKTVTVDGRTVRIKLVSDSENCDWGFKVSQIVFRSAEDGRIVNLVSFDANGGQGGPECRIADEDGNVALGSEIPKKNYMITFEPRGGECSYFRKSVKVPFGGWNTETGGKGESFDPGKVYDISDNLTLYAQWNSAKLGTMPVPERDRYLFIGWYDSPAGGEQVSGETEVNEDTTVFAHWKPLDHKVNDWYGLESSHPYRCGVVETWKYTSPSSQTLYLELKFDRRTFAEKDSDVITIRNSAGKIIGHYTGSGLSGKTVLVPGKTVKISVESESNAGGWGFKVSQLKEIRTIRGTYIRSLSAGRGAVTVGWNKVNNSGYQIRYSRYSSMKSSRYVTVSGSGTVSRKLTSLKPKTRYYVQVRTYKKVAGVKYYSSWSTKKSVTVK